MAATTAHEKAMAAFDAMRERALEDYNELIARQRLDSDFDTFFEHNRSHYESEIPGPEPTLKFSDQLESDETREYYDHQKALGYFNNTSFELFKECHANA